MLPDEPVRGGSAVVDLHRDAPVYAIGVVEKLTGLTARQIRYYEKMGLLHPARTPGNQRLYSPSQVELLRKIKALMGQGYTLDGVKSLLAGTARSKPLATPTPSEPEPAGGEDRLRLLRALRSGQPLSSLYPVNNQAELVRKLQQNRSQEAP